jgi:hypothetical protein
VTNFEKLIKDLTDPVQSALDAAEALKVYEWCINGVQGVGTVDDLAALVHPAAATCWMRDVGWRDLPGEYDTVGTLFTHPSYDPETCERGEATMHLGGPFGYPALTLFYKTEPQPRWEVQPRPLNWPSPTGSHR